MLTISASSRKTNLKINIKEDTKGKRKKKEDTSKHTFQVSHNMKTYEDEQDMCTKRERLTWTNLLKDTEDNFIQLGQNFRIS